MRNDIYFVQPTSIFLVMVVNTLHKGKAVKSKGLIIVTAAAAMKWRLDKQCKRPLVHHSAMKTIIITILLLATYHSYTEIHSIWRNRFRVAVKTTETRKYQLGPLW